MNADGVTSGGLASGRAGPGTASNRSAVLAASLLGPRRTHLIAGG